MRREESIPGRGKNAKDLGQDKLKNERPDKWPVWPQHNMSWQAAEARSDITLEVKGFWANRTDSFIIQVPLLMCCVTSSKLLNLSVPRCLLYKELVGQSNIQRPCSSAAIMTLACSPHSGAGHALYKSTGTITASRGQWCSWSLWHRHLVVQLQCCPALPLWEPTLPLSSQRRKPGLTLLRKWILDLRFPRTSSPLRDTRKGREERRHPLHMLWETPQDIPRLAWRAFGTGWQDDECQTQRKRVQKPRANCLGINSDCRRPLQNAIALCWRLAWETGKLLRLESEPHG